MRGGLIALFMVDSVGVTGKKCRDFGTTHLGIVAAVTAPPADRSDFSPTVPGRAPSPVTHG
ncbi:hypothetical protein, partial [Klebsiella pneumoniae]|uniref:hypothetical protein n=1 Tax=Klebsiella pneumoniae TaxID=573 RepID=UPI001D0EF196